MPLPGPSGLSSAQRAILKTLWLDASFDLSLVQLEYFFIRLLVGLAATEVARGAAFPDCDLQLENFAKAAFA